MLTSSPFLGLVILVLIVGFIVAVLVYLIDSSPVAQPFKGWARWLLIAIAVIYCLMRALTVLGVSI